MEDITRDHKYDRTTTDNDYRIKMTKKYNRMLGDTNNAIGLMLFFGKSTAKDSMKIMRDPYDPTVTNYDTFLQKRAELLTKITEILTRSY